MSVTNTLDHSTPPIELPRETPVAGPELPSGEAAAWDHATYNAFRTTFLADHAPFLVDRAAAAYDRATYNAFRTTFLADHAPFLVDRARVANNDRSAYDAIRAADANPTNADCAATAANAGNNLINLPIHPRDHFPIFSAHEIRDTASSYAARAAAIYADRAGPP